VSVRGIAYDSVRNAPLAAALVVIGGSDRSAITDDRGRFRFDSVMPGTYRLEMQHAVLDTMGLSGISRSVRIVDGREEIRLAVPSFGSLWTAACGTQPPKDSGFVFGSIRDATSGASVSDAIVDLAWLDLRVDGEQHVTQKRWRAEGRSDAKGSYAICGVPTDVNLRMRAATDSSASGLIDLPALGLRVQRRDISVGRTTSRATRRGTIAGFVTDTLGRPIANARLVSDEVPETRTDTAGRFTVREVPAGTRQLEVMSIGMVAQSLAVDVLPGDTTRVSVGLRRINQLEAVRITASAVQRRALRGIDERKRFAFGKIIDSTVIGGMGTIVGALFSMPSVEVEHGRRSSDFWITLPGIGRGRCLALLYVDGVRQRGFRDDAASAYDILSSLHTDEIAAIEVYPRAYSMPAEFMGSGGEQCGAVVVWTKQFIR